MQGPVIFVSVIVIGLLLMVFVRRDSVDQLSRLAKHSRRMAEKMHDNLGLDHHDVVFCSQGKGHATPNVVELKIEERDWFTFRHYPNHGFRGFFRDENGKRMMAVLQKHTGDGDGTVPLYSSGVLNQFCSLDPKPLLTEAEHQPAYSKCAAIQDFTVAAVVSLCEQRFKDKHG